MLLRRTKIDPYCSFTVNLGPQYVERVFETLLTMQGVSNVFWMSTSDRLQRYLQYLHLQTPHSNLRRCGFIQFYIGHFSQQLAAQQESQTDGWHLREKAICHYEIYLELADDTAESRFYAQWQTALLQQKLDYPWLQVEASFLKATTCDATRGEPLQRLVDHYCQAKAWRTAYSLSSLAIKHYFDKDPAAIRRWFVDFNAYNWRLLYSHLFACYHSGRRQETERTYKQLLEWTCRHAEELSNADMKMVGRLQKIFKVRKGDKIIIYS